MPHRQYSQQLCQYIGRIELNAFKKKGYERYIKVQYPETVPLIDAMDKLSEKSYLITLDSGEVVTIQPLPFCRNITPKPAKPAETTVTPTEGAVQV